FVDQAGGADKGEFEPAHRRKHGERQAEGTGSGFRDWPAALQMAGGFGTLKHEASRQQLHQREAGGEEIGSQAREARRFISGKEITLAAHRKKPSSALTANILIPRNPAWP